MAVKIEKPIRKFLYDDEELVDPNPALTPQEVASFYASKYPELVTAVASEPKLEDGKLVIEFNANAGTKG